MDLRNLVSDEQMRNILQVTRQTMYNFRKAGMPHYKIEGTIRYDKKEVTNWIKQQRVVEGER
ncbi:hypothetical protein [Bacillus phage vB_BceS-M2]|nr:hypothetical protein PBC5_058 [Bacillus phage PBC5]